MYILPPSFHSNPKRRAMPKNVKTTAQLHSFHKARQYKISCCGFYHIFPGVKRLLINEKAKSLAVVIVLYLLEEIQFFVACLFMQET